MAEVDQNQYEKVLEGKEYTNESGEDRKTRLIDACNIRAVNSVQKAWVFDRRGKRYKFKLKVLTFLGVAVPAVVGSIVLSFAAGVRETWFTYILAVAGILSVVQIVLALWALSAKWDDAHAYATESVSANRALYRRYHHLAVFPPKSLREFEREFEKLGADYQCRRDSDDKQALTGREKRAGYRAGLIEVRMPCPTCGKNPTSIPSDCQQCGNYSRWQKLLQKLGWNGTAARNTGSASVRESGK